MMEEQNTTVTNAQVSEPSSAQTVDPAPQTPDISTPASTEPVKQESEVYNKDQMRVISNDVKRRTEERLRAEYEAKIRELHELQPNYQQENRAEQVQKPSIAALSEEQLYSNFKQRQQEEQQEIEQQNVVNTFLNKVQAAGIGQKIESSGLGQLPVNHPLIPMLNSLDNVTDIIDDFDENPAKVANLLAVTMLNPMNGFKELQKISQSIKRNKEALAKPKAAEPSPQLKPSSYGLGGGISSVSEKRKSSLFKF
jgi:hypothetical protein